MPNRTAESEIFRVTEHAVHHTRTANNYNSNNDKTQKKKIPKILSLSLTRARFVRMSRGVKHSSRPYLLRIFIIFIFIRGVYDYNAIIIQIW